MIASTPQFFHISAVKSLPIHTYLQTKSCEPKRVFFQFLVGTCGLRLKGIYVYRLEDFSKANRCVRLEGFFMHITTYSEIAGASSIGPAYCHTHCANRLYDNKPAGYSANRVASKMHQVFTAMIDSILVLNYTQCTVGLATTVSIASHVEMFAWQCLKLTR